MMPEEPMAKRIAPPTVAPITNAGVRYEALCEGIGSNEASGIVRAYDSVSGKMLWRHVLYVVKYSPNKETDVQDVWISAMALKNGELVVTNEKHEVFHLDPINGKVLKRER